MKITTRIGIIFARVGISATGGVLWHFGYHACAITYFFYIIINGMDRIEQSRALMVVDEEPK